MMLLQRHYLNIDVEDGGRVVIQAKEYPDYALLEPGGKTRPVRAPVPHRSAYP